MSDLWLKIKVWSKIGIFALVTLYLLLFIFSNSGEVVNVWVWFGPKTHPTLLELIIYLLLAGAMTTLLARMAISTVRQIKDMRYRNEAAQLSKDLADMKAKAEMLVTKPTGTNPPGSTPSTPSSPP
jgi:uncharacterized integral membrane protein